MDDIMEEIDKLDEDFFVRYAMWIMLWELELRG